MGQVLYRKYRSRDLDEVVGQEHITTPLKHALKSGKLAHAYLFTGPRGVGKTSVARILAYAINDLPYSEDSNLDIIEIDAASNRRIDEIRDLRDKVNIAPAKAKYKVYIIDEVHMLTREAFNALLKTLEEPPEHVVFILATTEAHKLPDTIISRTQRYSFKPVQKQKVVDHLRSISKKEKILIDDDALELIADHGEGSFRDSISLLDQLSNQDEKVTLGDVRQALGIAPTDAVESIISTIAELDLEALNKLLTQLYEQGYQATILAKQLGVNLRSQLLANQSQLPRDKIIHLLRQLLEVPTSADPEALLEIVLFDGILVPSQEKHRDAANPSVVMSKKIETFSAEPSSPKRELVAGREDFDITVWPELLSTIKNQHNTLYSFLRMARPEFSKKGLVLHFGFKFHQQRIDEAKNKQSIQDALYELTGKNVEITCLFGVGTIPFESSPSDVALEIENLDAVTDPAIDTINNIFGGGEVLES